jgi:hypothetical protein
MDDFDLLNNFANSTSEGIFQAFGNPVLPNKITNSDILNYILNFLGYNNPNYLIGTILNKSNSGKINLSIKYPTSFMKSYLATFGNLNDYDKFQFDKDTLITFVPFILRDILITCLSKVKGSDANKISITDVSYYILNLEKQAVTNQTTILLGKMLLQHPTIAWNLDYTGNNTIVKKIMPTVNFLSSSYAVVPFNLAVSAYIKLKIKKDLSGIFTDAEKKYKTLFFMGLLNPEISNRETPFSISDMLLSNVDAGKCVYYGICRIILAASNVLNLLYINPNFKSLIESLYSLPFGSFSKTIRIIFFDFYLKNVYAKDVNDNNAMAKHLLEDLYLFPTSFTISNVKYDFVLSLPTETTELSWEMAIWQYMNWISFINESIPLNSRIKIRDIFVNRSTFSKNYSELKSKISTDTNFTKFLNWQNKYLIASVITTEIEQLVVYSDFYNEFAYIVNNYKTTGGKQIYPFISTNSNTSTVPIMK